MGIRDNTLSKYIMHPCIMSKFQPCHSHFCSVKIVFKNGCTLYTNLLYKCVFKATVNKNNFVAIRTKLCFCCDAQTANLNGMGKSFYSIFGNERKTQKGVIKFSKKSGKAGEQM